MSSEVQYHGYYARDSTGSDYENSRSPNADDVHGSPNGFEFQDEYSQDSLSDFSAIQLDGYDGGESQHASFGQRHNSIGSEGALANASNGGSSTRKRAFSNTASSSGGTGEKRTATKICRVCGDKAYSYNFNVITCESCKAFFRRNANKEKDIRCPFNEQCDINLVSRRFCQKCRLDKCFRVGMKKEWIMSEEARLEKKQRIQDNRERRMAERDRAGAMDDQAIAPPSGAPTTMMQQEPHFLQQSTATLQTQPMQVPVLPPALIPAAPLLSQPSSDLAQQLAAHMSPTMALEPSAQPAAIAAAAGFCPPGFVEPQNTNSSPILPSTATVSATAAAAQTLANQQIVAQAQAQLAAAQVAQVAQAAQAAQVVQAQLQQAHQAQLEQHMQNQAAQTLQQHVQNQAAHLQQQRMEMRELQAAQQIAVAQQHQAAAAAAQQIVNHQQAQLAAAVVAAAASAMQQPPPQTVGTTAAEIVAAATAPALPAVIPSMAPQTVAATMPQLVPPLDVSPPAVSQELIAVPKDVLIKLVEQKIENDQQQMVQHEVKPLKCQCHCQCGRYPNEILIVDKVMADLLESSSQHSHRADVSRLESPHKREPESSVSEPMDTNVVDADFSALNVTDSAYLAEILQANSVWANPVEGLNDDALRRLIKMLGRITGFRILSRQDQIALVRNTCEEYFILRSAMSQAASGSVWSGPPLGYPLNAEAQAAILERGVMFHNALREEWRSNESIMFLLGLIVLFNPEVSDLQSRESVAAENHKHRSLLKKTLFTLRQDPQRAYIEYCELMNKLSELKLSLGRLNSDTVEPLMREVFDPTSIAVAITTGHFVNPTMV